MNARSQELKEGNALAMVRGRRAAAAPRQPRARRFVMLLTPGTLLAAGHKNQIFLIIPLSDTDIFKGKLLLGALTFLTDTVRKRRATGRCAVHPFLPFQSTGQTPLSSTLFSWEGRACVFIFS